MAKKLVGIGKIKALDVEKLEFEITFAFDDGSVMPLATYFPAVEQMLPALSQIVTAVRESQRGTAQQVVAEDVRECVVEKDQWEDVVVVRFVSVNGAPYTFAIPPQSAREIAERLRIEAAKPHQVGRA
jgi:hypothetical protein